MYNITSYWTNKADLEIELLELLEDEGFKQYKNNCHTIMEIWKHVSILNTQILKTEWN